MKALPAIRRGLHVLREGGRRSLERTRTQGQDRWASLHWTPDHWREAAAQVGLQPQPRQQVFSGSTADITIAGGAAFGGKTWWLLYEALRDIHNPHYGFVIFRRTTPQITNEGALWDESERVYPKVGAVPKRGRLEWNFPSGARGRFAHMEHEKDRHAWDGAQIPTIGFDQLEHFAEKQFWYMLSRNRTTIGVKPRILATCNPDPDSFLARLLAWWIDPETGYALEERAGRMRYFLRDGDEILWGDTRQELVDQYPHLVEGDPEHAIKSICFIPSTMEDNPIGMAKDPGYVGNLNSLQKVERERLKRGNWKIRPSAGEYFRRSYFELVDQAPPAVHAVRAWDLGATAKEEGGDPSWTVGGKMILAVDGFYYLTHAERLLGSPFEVERALKNTAQQDGESVLIRLPQDPGQAGKAQAQRFVRLLAGYRVKIRPVTGDKITRAGGFSSQAEAGNVRIVRGPWNEAVLDVLEAFPEGHDDDVDAFSDAFDELNRLAGWQGTTVGAAPASVPKRELIP